MTNKKMPGLRLRLNKNGSSSSDSPSHQRPPSDLNTPRESSSARDEWNRKRALKLKTSPDTSTTSSTTCSDGGESYDVNSDHHYLWPLKISSSQHEVEYESPPRHYYYSSSNQQRQQHGRVSAKGALLICMSLISFTVGVVFNWNHYTGPPRSVELFDTMSHYYDRSIDHDRMLWLVNQNIIEDHMVPPPPLENSDMDKTDTGINESNDEDEEDRHVKAQKITGNEEECVPKASWQTTSYPTCNNIHEIDFIHSVTRQGRSHVFAQSVHDRRFVTNYSSSKSLQQKQEMDLTLLGQGWFRSAWKVETETAPFKLDYDDDEWDAEWLREESLVLKTLRIEREFLDEYYELHRRDAMAMERLTHSKYVLDVYGYCGQSVLNELASHGTLLTMMKYQAHKKMRLKLAYGIARGVSDLHSIDYADFSSSTVGKKSNSTLVHYDLNFHNIAIQDGRLPKLNDFNVAMFLSWDPKKRATCGFEGRFMEPWYRSPEEMQNHIDDGTDGILLDEKIDVYSLGNILWGILTGKPPWKKDKDPIAMDELRPRVARGELPELPSRFANSIDPTIVAIRDAMFKCLKANPKERASAGEVAHDLKLAMIEVKRLEKEEKKKKKEAEKIKKAEEAAAKELKLEEERKKKEAEEAAAEASDKEGADLSEQLLQELMMTQEEQKEETEMDAAKAFDKEGADMSEQLLARRQELMMTQEEQKIETTEMDAASAFDKEGADMSEQLLARRQELMTQEEQKKEVEEAAAKVFDKEGADVSEQLLVQRQELMTVTPLDKEIDDVAQQLELMSKEGHREDAEGIDFTRSINY